VKTKRKTSPIKRILVPTDFSSHSTHAIDHAAIVAKQFDSEVILIHVIESLPYSVTDTFNIVEHRRALETTAGSLLENLRKDLIEKDLSVRTHLVTGTPYREILKKSGREKVDLIVMGTHGRTGVKRLLLGSVAEKVVRLSTCPVLTVRVPSKRHAATPAKSTRNR